jgi:hypothetical protein
VSAASARPKTPSQGYRGIDDNWAHRRAWSRNSRIVIPPSERPWGFAEGLEPLNRLATFPVRFKSRYCGRLKRLEDDILGILQSAALKTLVYKRLDFWPGDPNGHGAVSPFIITRLVYPEITGARTAG